MAKIDLSTLEKTAFLARLQFSSDQSDKLIKELTDIFNLFDTLIQTNLQDFEPLHHPLELTQPLREDAAINCDMHQNISQNAPDYQDGFITVPAVLKNL